MQFFNVVGVASFLSNLAFLYFSSECSIGRSIWIGSSKIPILLNAYPFIYD